MEAGLEHLQLSFQDLDEASANHIAGTKAHAIKLALAPVIRKSPLAFTVNLVVHRMNLDRLEQFIAMAEELGPDRLEIAHVQYYGWALKNRSLLMPTEEQVYRSLEIVANAKERLRGKIQLESVFPDYFGSFPKACVGGWGRQMMLVDPAGNVLPCHAAAVIPNLEFDSVRAHELGWIWRESSAFQHFRGDAWMPDTCLKCPRKEIDFGGCRCQAYQLTGDAKAIDPVCRYSPSHGLLETLRSCWSGAPTNLAKLECRDEASSIRRAQFHTTHQTTYSDTRLPHLVPCRLTALKTRPPVTSAADIHLSIALVSFGYKDEQLAIRTSYWTPHMSP